MRLRGGPGGRSRAVRPSVGAWFPIPRLREHLSCYMPVVVAVVYWGVVALSRLAAKAMSVCIIAGRMSRCWGSITP